MLWFSLFFSALAVGLLSWVLPRYLWGVGKKQQRSFEQQSERFLASRFVFIKGHELFKTWLVVLFLLLVFIWLLLGSWLLVFLTAVVFCFLWPIYRYVLAKKRIKQFEKQFPDYLLSLASALKAGTSLSIAMQRMVLLTKAPLRDELALLLREQRMGLSLLDALDRLHERVSCETTSLFKSAVAVSGQSGGGLAELLERMAHSTQQRLHIEDRIYTLTAQGRMQAIVMVCLPFLVAVALYVLDPELIAPLWQQRSGQVILVLIACLELVGLWMIHRIIHIRI